MAMPAGIFSCNNRDWGKLCEVGEWLLQASSGWR